MVGPGEETFLTLKVRNRGSGVWEEHVEEGKAPSLIGQFSPSKFLVRNCYGQILSFFSPRFRPIQEIPEGLLSLSSCYVPLGLSTGTDPVRLPIVRAGPPGLGTLSLLDDHPQPCSPAQGFRILNSECGSGLRGISTT